MPSNTQKSLFNGTSYAEADAFLTARNSSCVKIANNTELERIGTIHGYVIVVRLHATNVVTYYPNGAVKLDSGGYRSQTTARRMSQFSPVSVALRPVSPSIVIVDNPVTGRVEIPYADGMIV
jgi:hypothetical protein